MKKTILFLILTVSLIVLVSCAPGRVTYKFAFYNNTTTKDYSVAVFNEDESEIIYENKDVFIGESFVLELEKGNYVVKLEGRNENTGYPWPGIKVELDGNCYICYHDKGYTTGGGLVCPYHP